MVGDSELLPTNEGHSESPHHHRGEHTQRIEPAGDHIEHETTDETANLALQRERLAAEGTSEHKLTQAQTEALTLIEDYFPSDLIQRLNTDPRDPADLFRIASGDAMDSSALTLPNLQELARVGPDVALRNGVSRFAPAAAYFIVQNGHLETNQNGSGNVFVWEHNLPKTRDASHRKFVARFDQTTKAITIDTTRIGDRQRLYSLSTPLDTAQVNGDNREQFGSTEYGRPSTRSKPFGAKGGFMKQLDQTRGFLACISRASHDISLATPKTDTLPQGKVAPTAKI